MDELEAGLMSVTAARRSTIADVAREAGVSAATVSRVLNRHPRVDPSLVERVEAAIKQVSYRPNSAGRALRRQRSDLWAAVVPDIRNPFFHEMLEAFEHVAHTQGYSVVLCNSQEDLTIESSALESVLAHQVSGVMIAATSATKTQLEPLLNAGIPVVIVDRAVKGFVGDAVSVDNEMSGALAADHLLERGYTAPVFVSHLGKLSPLVLRERGFTRRMSEAGYPVPPEHIIRLPFHDQEQVLQQHLTKIQAMDAVFAATNSLTSHSYVVLRATGHAIGQDVGLVGVDDDQWNSMVDPDVTVIEQPAQEVGEWAGRLLLGRLEGREMKHARITLNPTLIVRGSSARRGGVID